MRPQIKEQDLEKWASFLINHSLGGVSRDDTVMVKAEHVCWDLVSVLQKKIIESGAIADIFIVPPDNDRGRVWSSEMIRNGSEDHLKTRPQWITERYKNMTKYIEILGAQNPSLFADMPVERAATAARSESDLQKIRMSKPWVLTLFPTKGFADMEGIDFKTYTELVVSASTENPAELLEIEEPIAELIDRGSDIRIITRHNKEERDLELNASIKGLKSVKCFGIRNFPDGEVYTSPDANSVNGEIFLDLPVLYSGTVISGIYLKFKDGRIADFSARKGESVLKTIINTDNGSKRVGEIAFGVNRGFIKPLMHPLFVEKTSGTLHIAIGASYSAPYINDKESEESDLSEAKENGRYNESSQHVDLVADFRKNGTGKSVFIDKTELHVPENSWEIIK